MLPADVEALAVGFYDRLGFDPSVPIDAFRLARRFLGPRAIERARGIAGAHASTFVVRGERRIAIKTRVSFAYQQHAIGHEIGHVLLDEINYLEDDTESVCDLFGACALAPRPAVVAMLRALGRDHEAMAETIGSTQTLAALRIAETLGMPRAVVTPQRIYARGPEEFVWGAPEDIRRMARAGRSRTPGIVRAKLTDDPRRVVIDVDATG